MSDGKYVLEAKTKGEVFRNYDTIRNALDDNGGYHYHN